MNGVLDGNLVIFQVANEEIVNKRYDRIRKYIHLLEQKGKQSYSTLHMSYGGYDFDDRELYEIEEVREWAKELVIRIPHIFFFLSNRLESFELLLMLISDELTSMRIGEAKSPVDLLADEPDISKWKKLKISITLKEDHYKMIQKGVSSFAKKVKANMKGQETMQKMDELLSKGL